MYLLDTNICIYLIKKQPRLVIEKLQSVPVTEVAISSITLSELEYGVEKSLQIEKNKKALERFLMSLEVLDYDGDAAKIYGRVRAELERKGTVMGALDTLIAAHGLSLDATLVTNNEREFRRVTGLKIENWVNG